MKKSACSKTKTGRDSHLLPVLLFTSSVNPSQASYPAAHPNQFRFSTPDRPVFYQVYGLVFGVVR
jgi:hypothetical protein